MKQLIVMALVCVGCSTMTQGKYKKAYHLEDYSSSQDAVSVHGMLTEKMTKCYPQSDYPMYEKTVTSFDATKQSGTIVYEVDNQSLGPKILVLVEVEKADSGSMVKVYSKGDLLRSPGHFKHQVHKWLDGKKVDCDSQGQI